MKSINAIAISSLLSLASAQYAINPNSVSSANKNQWCVTQKTSCPLICLDGPSNSAETRANDCDTDTLTYACVCADGQSPNISEYSQTLPFFICQTWGTQCQANCGTGNTLCITDCVEKHPCGAQSPKRVNVTSSSTTGAATVAAAGATTMSGGGVVYTGLGGSGGDAQATGNAGGGAAAPSQSASAAASNMRAAALNAGQTFGLLGVAGVLFGGFAVLL